MTMICTIYAQLNNNNYQELQITRNINNIEDQQPRRSRLLQHIRTRQLSKQDTIDTIDNNGQSEQRQRRATSEATGEEEDLDQNMLVDKLVYYENPYISSLTDEEVDKEEELKTDRMVDGSHEAAGYLDYTEVSSTHNTTGILGKSGKSNTLISRKSKSGKGTKSNSLHYEQVKEPIFGKARKGKSSKTAEFTGSSKGSKKSKLFGQMANGTASPTDTLGPKSWKGTSSEDGSTNKDTRVYDEEEFPYWHYHTNNKDTRTINVMNVSCSKSNPCSNSDTHFCKMSSGSCMSDEEEGICTEFGSLFCKQSLEPVCGCDNVVYSNSCQTNYLYGINVQCVLGSESTLQVGQSCDRNDCALVDEEV